MVLNPGANRVTARIANEDVPLVSHTVEVGRRNSNHYFPLPSNLSLAQGDCQLCLVSSVTRAILRSEWPCAKPRLKVSRSSTLKCVQHFVGIAKP